MLSVSYEVFYAVACHLSFSKAAEVLCISQPAVSKQIKKLESLIEVPLFERQGNAIALTPQGEKNAYLFKRSQVDSKPNGGGCGDHKKPDDSKGRA